VTDGNETGALGVNNIARLHHAKPFLKNGIKSSPFAYLKFKTYSGLNDYSDETIIQFKENAGDFYDPQYDAYKFTGLDEAPQIYTVASDPIKLAVNSMGELTEDKTVSMGYKVGVNGYYTVNVIEMQNFDETAQVLLEDKKENVFIDLKEQNMYSFYADSMDETDRFNLHFLLDQTIMKEPSNELDIHIYSHQNTIYLKRDDMELIKGNLSVFDLLGRLIISEDVNTINQHQLLLNKEGVLFVTFWDMVNNKYYSEKILMN
jgi:hypothetical protein